MYYQIESRWTNISFTVWKRRGILMISVVLSSLMGNDRVSPIAVSFTYSSAPKVGCALPLFGNHRRYREQTYAKSTSLLFIYIVPQSRDKYIYILRGAGHLLKREILNSILITYEY